MHRVTCRRARLAATIFAGGADDAAGGRADASICANATTSALVLQCGKIYPEPLPLCAPCPHGHARRTLKERSVDRGFDE
jgi:hypothetical protein